MYTAIPARPRGNTDRRILRSWKNMQDALLALLEEHHYSDLTIAQIADAAGVTRRTFYQHFDSIETLLASCVANSLDEFVADVDDANLQLPLTQHGLLQKIFIFLQTQTTFVDTILSKGPSYIVVGVLAQYVLKMYEHILAVNRMPTHDIRMSGYFADYFASGSYGVIHHWAVHGHRETPEELAVIFGQLLGPSVDAHFQAQLFDKTRASELSKTEYPV